VYVFILDATHSVLFSPLRRFLRSDLTCIVVENNCTHEYARAIRRSPSISAYLQISQPCALKRAAHKLTTHICSGVESRQGQELFSLQNRSDRLWGRLSLLFNGYMGSFPGVKRPGREADLPSPSSAEVKSDWSYTSVPPIYLHSVEKDITLLLTLLILHLSQPYLRHGAL
jgi:hypothetical protein